jgi:nitrile hydratase
LDGIHDLGGMEGFGPVEVEPDEPVFHFDWERTAMGVTFAAFAIGLTGNTSTFRHAIERMDPVHYLTSRYYEHWATAVATLMVEKGWTTHDELDQRAGGVFLLSRPPVQAALSASDDGPDRAEPRFQPGDTVRVAAPATRGHTRCPGYVRGRTGTVVRVDPATPLPDVEAHSPDGRSHREPIYCVRFELDATTSVHVDLWESYLQ